MSDTFILKRYSLARRTYVDSKNIALPEYRHFPQPQGDPSKPAKDGSAPFLSLPTELRLQIYAYLTNNDIDYVHQLERAFDVATSAGQSITFAYLYRSPGRLSKPHSISSEVINLFHVCHTMREELIDACFSDRTFILEASLYRRDAGGLFVLPPNPGPVSWIKKLVLLTVVEGDGLAKGIGDLRPLQQMTNLKELSIVFSMVNTKIKYHEYIDRPDNVLKAIQECIPSDTKVSYDPKSATVQQLFTQFKNMTWEKSFETRSFRASAQINTLIEDLAASEHRKGILSGSLVNHGLCEYGICLEDAGCVNSHCDISAGQNDLVWPAQPDVFNTRSRSQQDTTSSLVAIGVQDVAKTPIPPAKRCVHREKRCDICNKGILQMVKRLAGQVYRY